MNLELGQMVQTCGIHARVQSNSDFGVHVADCIRRHYVGDWGDLCEDDKEVNEAAVNPPEGCEPERVMSVYESVEHPKIWIITERDRSSTTVLFPDEY